MRAAIVALTVAGVVGASAPAHAGFWSSISATVSGWFSSGTPSRPSGNYTMVRTTTYVNGRPVVTYRTVPLSSSSAPSNGYNGYGDPRYSSGVSGYNPHRDGMNPAEESFDLFGGRNITGKVRVGGRTVTYTTRR